METYTGTLFFEFPNEDLGEMDEANNIGLDHDVDIGWVCFQYQLLSPRRLVLPRRGRSGERRTDVCSKRSAVLLVTKVETILEIVTYHRRVHDL